MSVHSLKHPHFWEFEKVLILVVLIVLGLFIMLPFIMFGLSLIGKAV